MTDRVILWVGRACPSILQLNQWLAASGYINEMVATGGVALELIARIRSERSVGVIVANDTIEDMPGVDFLRQARVICPQAATILLLPDSDRAEVLSASTTNAYHFISGIQDVSVLTDCIARIFEHYELVEENRRLTLELTSTNEELKLLNMELEARVKEKIEEVIRVVNYDALTGLPSRTLIQERLKFSIQYAKRSGQPVVVMCIGLDSFKLVNEGAGFEAGDLLLQAVGKRLSTSMRACDSVGRLGSDRFCLVVNDAKDADDPEKVAKRLLDFLGVPFQIAGHDIFLTASIGISIFPTDGMKAQVLLAHAETAMVQAKEESKNHCRFYSCKSNLMASRQLSLSADLRRALDANEFYLCYQPRVNIVTGRMVGVEALLRWRHPEHGVLPPLDFLPLLEDTGLIEPVGEWVISEACKVLVRWAKYELPQVNMAVNLSAKQFRNHDLFSRVSGIIQQSGVDLKVSSLEFEITESLLMENVDEARQTLRQFNDLGIKLAVDDFGTGYSSLSYLIQFPLHYLKIDRSFVDKVVDNPDSRAIVRAIVNLATSLKLKVIVEGIENLRQLKVMQELECTEFQGYFFSEPLTEEEILKLLKSDKILSQTALPADDLLVDERQGRLH